MTLDKSDSCSTYTSAKDESLTKAGRGQVIFTIHILLFLPADITSRVSVSIYAPELCPPLSPLSEAISDSWSPCVSNGNNSCRDVGVASKQWRERSGLATIIWVMLLLRITSSVNSWRSADSFYRVLELVFERVNDYIFEKSLAGNPQVTV